MFSSGNFKFHLHRFQSWSFFTWPSIVSALLDKKVFFSQLNTLTLCSKWLSVSKKGLVLPSSWKTVSKPMDIPLDSTVLFTRGSWAMPDGLCQQFDLWWKPCARQQHLDFLRYWRLRSVTQVVHHTFFTDPCTLRLSWASVFDSTPF